MNTENSKTSEPYRLKLDLTDKLNLKNPSNNMALPNLSILLQLGIILLIYLMVLTQLQIFRIILNLSSKNMTF